MKLRHYFFALILMLLVSTFAVSCGEDDEEDSTPPSSDGAQDGGGTTGTQPTPEGGGTTGTQPTPEGGGTSSTQPTPEGSGATGTQPTPEGGTQTPTPEKPVPTPPKVITLVSGENNDCYIVYESDRHYAAALAIRSQIKSKTGVPITANAALIHTEEDATTSSELIIGMTDRSVANSAIESCISKISDSRDYFFFIHSGKYLILYASSDDAYLAAAESFSDIFLKNGTLSFEEDFYAVRFME